MSEDDFRSEYAGDSYGLPEPCSNTKEFEGIDPNKQDVHRELSVPEFETLCNRLYDKREELDGYKEELKIKQSEYEDLCLIVMSYMDKYKKSSYPVSGRGTLVSFKRLSVKTPQEPDARKEFFDYLKGRDLFDAFITVNYQTLNSFYREEQKQAVDAGASSFSMPGIGEPNYTDILQVRKK